MINTHKLKSARLNMGLTQAQLANKLDVTRETIYRWETGKEVPTLTNLSRWAKTLDVSLSDLFA
ncbi:helix-turn-helix transcriptional regulator [Streptomyces europaeiscabiei]|uniref:helix-turn-helix transcriptional regulator n=1 Tax=Streptomyces europaeiscabiei TaxID=146819 RepID=UPI0038F6B55F